ncbi:MAG: hypothetical protein Kow0069_38550 [Promethearchaeota archaeon]
MVDGQLGHVPERDILDEYDEEDLVKITKFQLAHNLMSLAVVHRDTGDFVFRYDSPMNRVETEIYQAALTEASKLDLMYGEVKVIQHPKGNVVVIFEGNYVRGFFILHVGGFTPLISRFGQAVLKEFVEEFESKYHKHLREWKGDETVLSEVNDILDKVVGLRMNLPHQAKYQGFEPESKTAKTVFEAADKITRKVGYFYLANLIGITKRYVVEKEEERLRFAPDKKKKKKGKKGKDQKKGKKAPAKPVPPEMLDEVPGSGIPFPRDEDFHVAMFELVKLGLLQPIPIEELDSYSKIDYRAIA